MPQTHSTIFLHDIVAGDSVETDTLATGGPLCLEQSDFSGKNLWEGCFFAESPYFHPELGIARIGETGHPVPYNMANDNVIIGIMLGCFLLSALAFSFSRNALYRQLRSFFYMPRREAEVMDSLLERRIQLLFVFQTAVMLGVTMFVYQHESLHAIFIWVPQTLVIIPFALACLVYVGVKWVLYQIVNWIFFDREKIEQWEKNWLFLFEMEGACIFPLLLLKIFGSISLPIFLYCVLFVLISAKILTFYKCFVIFFKVTRVYVQIFLYFCALELMPMFALLGVLMVTSNYLRIIF